MRKFARDVAARRKGAERGAVQLAVDASRQFFDHAALAKDDKMSFAHFARWRRLAPPVSVYCPVGLLEPPTASPAAGLAPIQEHHSSDIMCTLAPLLLHFVPGATLVARARNAFKSMDKGTGMLSHDDLVQGLSKLYVFGSGCRCVLLVHAWTDDGCSFAFFFFFSVCPAWSEPCS